MEIVVLGTVAYQWALWPFAHLFEKYWSDQTITWYGDRQEGDIPENVEFRRVPCYTQGVWPWQHWFGNGLISILDELEGDVVALFLPDHWIAAPVGIEAVLSLKTWMAGQQRVVRGNLAAETCLDGHGKHMATWGGYEIVRGRPDDVHCSFHGGVTFCPSLFNRRLLRSLLEPHWNLWEVESLGTRAMARRDLFSVGLRPGPVERCHALHHGRPKSVSLAGLCPLDKEIVRGMIPGGWTAWS
jgi:hypothetical protein